MNKNFVKLINIFYTYHHYLYHTTIINVADVSNFFQPKLIYNVSEWLK